jgi:Ni,Fe-hydrogenase III small subunit/Pyruvate/2-oxoacid:ferredoxin oxidoreductase delta subunit
MLRELLVRLQSGHATIGFPTADAPPLPVRFRGRPVVDAEVCPPGCSQCVSACPTRAIELASAGLQVDLGRCLFCVECAAACPEAGITYSQDYRLATRRREDLVVRPEQELRLADSLDRELRRLLSRSLRLRQVSAGGCNACEADVNVLSTIVWDAGRFGIQLVASPRHADGLLITGPVTTAMETALRKTYDAVPAPKIVIATGACAISGGPFLDQPEQLQGASSVVPVDLFIPGCPPHPLTILDGLLRLLGRLETEGRLI